MERSATSGLTHEVAKQITGGGRWRHPDAASRVHSQSSTRNALPPRRLNDATDHGCETHRSAFHSQSSIRNALPQRRLNGATAHGCDTHSGDDRERSARARRPDNPHLGRRMGDGAIQRAPLGQDACARSAILVRIQLCTERRLSDARARLGRAHPAHGDQVRAA